MELHAYSQAARATAIYPRQYGLMYPALKLAGEAGEVAENVGKMLRDDDGQLTPERRMKIIKELGDVLWYISNLADDIGSTLEEVAVANIDKLASRQQRGVLHGSGDER